MKLIRQQFTVPFEYEVVFTDGLFDCGNPLFKEQVEAQSVRHDKKLYFVLDEGMYKKHPGLWERIRNYISTVTKSCQIVSDPLVIPGGEAAKNDNLHIKKILNAVDEYKIDRHSFIVVIGGGAVIDTAGYAAAVAHRGIRLIRIPTTVLAQNDAAIGVKNGMNAFGKKNFIGTFVPPYAVLNDFLFLKTLDDRDWRSGISEAVKVALIKDSTFFRELEESAALLVDRDMKAMKKLIYRCAELHLEHIANSGDPFEMGSSRPLDFGHWSAHKLEQLTEYEIRHGEAVAIGIALDTVYSSLKGLISQINMERVLSLFKECGFHLYVPELENKIDKEHHPESIFQGLEEFREHLGGKLTIMLLQDIGTGIEVNQVDTKLYREAVQTLKSYEAQPVRQVSENEI